MTSSRWRVRWHPAVMAWVAEGPYGAGHTAFHRWDQAVEYADRRARESAR